MSGPEQKPDFSPKESRPLLLAKWFDGLLDDQSRQWVEQEYPVLTEQRANMGEEEFDDWFIAWWFDGWVHSGDFIREEEYNTEAKKI